MNISMTRILPAGVFGAALLATMGTGAALAQESSYEGPNGGSVTRVYDPETGEFYAVKNRVGPNGATRTVERKCSTKDVEFCGATRTTTGADGNTYVNNTAGVLGEKGLRIGQRRTGPDGKVLLKRRRLWLRQNDD